VAGSTVSMASMVCDIAPPSFIYLSGILLLVIVKL
jgi:hypothetical protein